MKAQRVFQDFSFPYKGGGLNNTGCLSAGYLAYFIPLFLSVETWWYFTKPNKIKNTFSASFKALQNKGEGRNNTIQSSGGCSPVK